jgi:hypothetical protein
MAAAPAPAAASAPPPTLLPGRYQGIKDFATNRAEYRSFLASLDDAIFRELKTSDDPNIVGTIVGTIQGSPLVASDFTRKDARYEVANIIAAAAAVETKDYTKLIELVNGLKSGAEWERIPFYVTRACLAQHLGQTNYFLLGLINSDNAELILTIRSFLKKHGVGRAANLSTFLYFAPEFIESDHIPKGWFESQYREAQRDKGSPEKSFWPALRVAELFTADPEKTPDVLVSLKTKRATGRGASELLQAVADDNVAKVQEWVAGEESKIDQEIEFSIYEQYLHHDYGFGQDGTGQATQLKAKTPARLIDAIGLFGATNTFNALVSQAKDKKKWIESGAASLLATGTKTGLLRQVFENAGPGALAYRQVFAFHDHDALDQLIDKGVKLLPADVEALFVSSNLQAALRYFDPDGARLKIDAAIGDSGPTVLHYIAKGNAITALKEYLLAKAEAGQAVPIVKSAGKSRNFLHWAGWFSGAAILDFWAIEIGNLALDQIDTENYGPCAIAYHGVYDPIEAKSPILARRKPEYVAVRDATKEEYTIPRAPDPA